MDTVVATLLGAPRGAAEFPETVGAFARSALIGGGIVLALVVAFFVYRLAAYWFLVRGWNRSTRRRKRADLELREALLADGYGESDIEDAIEHSER